jgi:SpoVK/Ycf46/Vps4 family AAA+-type ATPase
MSAAILDYTGLHRQRIAMAPSWDWRKNYRVWDANRKVFVYPENWIEPDPRVSPRLDREVREVAKAAHERRTALLLTATPAAATPVTGRALAASLARDLYRADLHDVVSKYIGETEKNLNGVFDEAARAHAVLLLDEADALFGHRPDAADASDRFLNAEISYLLQRIEAYDRLVVVATNAPRATVAPLARRFPFVIDHVSPDS